MSTGRNRSEGWTYAKRSGHENEQRAKAKFDDEHFCKVFSNRLGIGRIVSADVGGLHEKSVPGVFGRKTKSKTDLKLHLDDGSIINISIKKSWGGQAAYQTIDSFLQGFEKQFALTVPDDIKYLFNLFFSSTPDAKEILEDPKVINKQNEYWVDIQKRHNCLNWTSLQNWDSSSANKFLQWFKDNIGSLAEYCFAKGLASDSDEWVDYIWFINLLGDEDLDEILSIKDIVDTVNKHPEEVIPGTKNGGTTIQLPFGFAQWHHAKIQVHDDLSKLLKWDINCL